MKEYDGIVLYTDGSARPNPGHNGWGSHGYAYTVTDKPKGDGNSKHIPTPEGYISKSDKDKVTEYANVTEYLDWFGSSTESRTNNAAELSAVIEPLTYILENYRIKKLVLLVDSEYIKKGIEHWLELWKKHDWVKNDGSPVLNRELWMEVDALLDKLEAEGIELSIIKVPAHSDVLGNELADKLALIGTLYSRKGIEKKSFKTTDAKGYWKKDYEKHPFLSFKRMFHNTVRDNTIRGHYFIAEHVKDQKDKENIYKEIGKKTASASYAVIELEEADEVLETLIDKTCELMNGINLISYVRLDRIYHRDFYPYLKEHGDVLFSYSENPTSVLFMDKHPLSTIVIPSCMAVTAIEYSKILEAILLDFKEQNGKYNYIDITDEFYGEKGKLHKHIDNKTKLFKIRVEIDGREIEVPIVLGLDLPGRNEMKRLEGEDTQVHLVTYMESDQHLRYHVLVRRGKDIGVWANFFAESIFLEK